MNFIVERRITKQGYLYKINNDDRYCATSNYTFGIGLRKCRVLEGCYNEIYSLKQKNWLLKIFTCPISPIFPTGLLPRYNFYDGGKCKGHTKWSCYTPKKFIVIDTDLYELNLHKNNYISVMKNDIQVALIKKSYATVQERNTYSISFDKCLTSKPFMLLLSAFIDIIYFPNHFRISYYKYEKTIGTDKLYNRTVWQPKG